VPAAMDTPPHRTIAWIDVAALIPKDPPRTPASQQTYRQAVEKGSRCVLRLVPDGSTSTRPLLYQTAAGLSSKSELDSAPGDPAHHRGDGRARRARRHLSRINRWRNTVSATRSPKRLVSRATHSSRQRVNVDDPRTGIAEGPADLRAAGCVFLQLDVPVTLEYSGDGIDRRRLRFPQLSDQRVHQLVVAVCQHRRR
jgi:hypothetical protein